MEINEQVDFHVKNNNLDNFHLFKNGYIISNDVWNKLYK